jgi:GT2 family glycosyltransferase
MSPRVSIGLPLYKSRLDFLELALDSLLGQELGDFELLVSDNGSPEELVEWVRNFAGRDRRVHIERHPSNRGPIFNYNHLLARAGAEYFLWAADDDVRDPRFLGEAVRALDANPHAVSAGCRVVFIDEEGERVGAPRIDEEGACSGSRLRRVRTIFLGQSHFDVYALHRTSVLRRIGGMPANLAPDNSLVLRLLLEGPIVRVPAELLHYRLRQGHTWAHQVQTVGAARAKAHAFSLERQVPLTLLRTVLTSGLPPPERAAYAAFLGAELLYRGTLMSDYRNVARDRFREALGQGKYGVAASEGLRFLILSPGAPFRASAWRGLWESFVKRLPDRDAD